MLSKIQPFVISGSLYSLKLPFLINSTLLHHNSYFKRYLECKKALLTQNGAQNHCLPNTSKTKIFFTKIVVNISCVLHYIFYIYFGVFHTYSVFLLSNTNKIVSPSWRHAAKDIIIGYSLKTLMRGFVNVIYSSEKPVI